MEVYVGTSGWFYDWNKDKNLSWYIKNTPLNIVELNMSFYRYPYPNQVKGWANKSNSLKWIIKVHRQITHIHRLNDLSVEKFNNFLKLFSPLFPQIEFFLFQLPPSFSEKNFKNLQKFFKNIKKLPKINNKIAIEFRNKTFFSEKYVKTLEKLNCIFVSVDSPQISFITKTKNIVYLRMHGRQNWYSYDYKNIELKEIYNRIKNINPEKAYILFNNNHTMLKNAEYMLKIFKH